MNDKNLFRLLCQHSVFFLGFSEFSVFFFLLLFFFILTAIHGLLIMGFYFSFFSSLNFISRPLELGGPPGTNLRGVC